MKTRPIFTITACLGILTLASCRQGHVDAPMAESAQPASVAARQAAPAPTAAPHPGVQAKAAAPARLLARNRAGMAMPAGAVGGFVEEAERDGQVAHDTEAYDELPENRFLETVGSPVSTFSIDVDTASYANVRRFLKNGRLPYAGAVRIEELVNYFTYDYPEPDGDAPFSFTTEVSDCPWAPGNKLLHIGLQAERISLEKLPPNNLVFLLDVSGSMNQPNKLPLLVSAFKLLVNEMRDQDRAAIVVYAGAAGLVLPPTSGDDKPAILAALDALRAGGSTAGGAGIRLAYQVAAEHYDPQGNNRVILATDGDFNVGVSSDAEMVKLIEEKRKQGVFLTVLGLGTGNYKDSKMEKLADKGNGNYAYIDTLSEAKKVLVTEMGGTLVTVAKDVKVQIEFNPAKVREYRLVGYENRLLRREDFDDDTKDAGELGAGHTVTVLYELVPETGTPAKDNLRYQETAARKNAAAVEELAFLKFRYKPPKDDKSQLITHPIEDGEVKLAASSDNFKFSAAVATWGMLLRGSDHKGTGSYEQVLELAEDGKGPDPNGYRAEFLELVKLTQGIAEESGK